MPVSRRPKSKPVPPAPPPRKPIRKVQSRRPNPDIPTPRERERERPYRAVPAAPGGVFLPDHEMLVRLIASKGMTDAEFELIYGLGSGTLKGWRKAYPNFDKALSEGRTSADAQVLFALFKNAVGFSYEEEQAVGGREPSVLSVKRFKPGETTAQKHWLGNRLRAEWPSVDRHELSGPNGGAIGIKTDSRNDMIDAILTLIQPKTDPERTPKATEGKR